MAWRWSVVNKFLRKKHKKSNKIGRYFMSKIKIVPPFWIISRCIHQVSRVWQSSVMRYKCAKFESTHGWIRPGWTDGGRPG
jgi:hypothetical protein